MVNMENAEEVMQILERYTRLKQKEIPKELDEYLQYVAKTGETVFKWSSLKYLFREKLLNVIKHFHDTTPRVDEIPQYPNVDPFNYESMKSSLLERLELFNSAPFTIQRLCELLIDPRKQYSRIDKFMRALEKNILVVSTIEPGRKRNESENGDSLDSVVNGDLSLDVNVDIDMENETLFNAEAQNGNGTNAVTPPAVAADSEAVPTVAAVEIREKPVTESPNVPHTADDDILPNPKKPKLDIEVVVAEAKAVAVAILAEVETKTGKAEKEKTADTTDDAADVDMLEKEENKENLNAVKIQSNAEEKPPVVNDKSKVGEQEKAAEVEEDHKQPEEEKKIEVSDNKKDQEEDVKVESTADQSTPVKEKETEVESAVIKVVPDKKVVEVETVSSSSTCKEVEDQKKVVEKQETETNEKQTADTTKIEQKAEKDVVIEQADELVADSKEKQPEEEHSTCDDKVSEAVVDEEAVKGSKKSDDAEVTTTTTTTNKTKEVEEKQAATEIETAQVKVKAAESAKIDSTASSNNIPETTNIKSDNEKAAVIAESTSKPTEVKDTKAEPITESLKATAATTEEISTSTAATKTEQEPFAAESSNDAVSTTTNDSSAISETKSSESDSIVAATVATSSDAEAVPSVDTDIKETPTESLSAEASISAEKITPPIVVTPPTLALNDHPMEEHTDVADDIAVAEVASSSPAAAEVEEVIMTETSSTGGVATAMATDAIEPAKDEPAGMEVDDTSQEEAMDQ